jgi:hypothetical protein
MLFMFVPSMNHGSITVHYILPYCFPFQSLLILHGLIN